MSDKKRAEYNGLMMELYKENQSFLNKAIFGISTLAIPFLFNALSSNEHSFSVSLLLAFSLVLFLGVILLQILSLKSARDGCDKSMETTKSAVEVGEILFNKARTLDIWREWLFIGGICVITISMFTAIIQKEVSMTENKNLKELQNSFTPPQAKVTEQKSFVPPKTTVSQNKPAEAVKPAPQSQNNNTGNK